MPSPSPPTQKTHVVLHNSSVGWLHINVVVFFLLEYFPLLCSPDLFQEEYSCYTKNNARSFKRVNAVLQNKECPSMKASISCPVVPLCSLLWYCCWVVLEVYIPYHIKHCCIVSSQIPLLSLLALRSSVLLYFSVHQPCFCSSCTLSELFCISSTYQNTAIAGRNQ